MAEQEKPELKPSDTTATDSSSQSMQDVQPSSPQNSTNPINPTTLEQPSSQSRPGTSGGRRRKVPDSVTPNACTNCKKARAKVRLLLTAFLCFGVRWKASILSYWP